MNSIRSIRELNKRELEKVVDPSASWHRDYADTAYVYIGGLPLELSEGDVLTIFSQYGEPTYLNLIRDKESGKSKGFAFLKYEDQRSTDLAVDNLGGATVMGRVLKVDHTRYKRKEGEDEEVERARELRNEVVGREKEEEESEEEKRPMLREEIELAKLIRDHDDDDPMKEYLVQEKREEVAQALKAVERVGNGERKRKHHHRRHGGDRGGRERDEEDGDSRRRHRHRHHGSRRSRSPRRSRSR